MPELELLEFELLELESPLGLLGGLPDGAAPDGGALLLGVRLEPEESEPELPELSELSLEPLLVLGAPPPEPSGFSGGVPDGSPAWPWSSLLWSLEFWSPCSPGWPAPPWLP